MNAVKITETATAAIQAHLDSLKVGDVVALGAMGLYVDAFTPVCHNSAAIAELGGSGCRGRVTRIGRKYIHISTRGSDWRTHRTVEPHKYIALKPDFAKPYYANMWPDPAHAKQRDAVISTL